MIDSISIVIPSYNESENINEIYKRTSKVIEELNIKKYEIIFVENGSKDNSLDLLKKINSENKSVKIISFSRNFGFQAAIAAGLKYAENNYVCVMDGDLQDSPDEIPKLYNKIMLDGYDLVSGWKKKRYDPISKTIPTKLFNWAARKASGIYLHDFNHFVDSSNRCSSSRGRQCSSS